ncbi:MAG: hypothetical protein RBJ76_03235 [Stenomitos frigidus ULC029]
MPKNDDRMRIEIKGVRFSGTAEQFERAIGQIAQMVVGRQGDAPQLQQAPAPERSTVPALPPAPAPMIPPRPMLPMTVTAGYESQFQTFQAVYNEFKPSQWIEINYVNNQQKGVFEELLAVFGREDAALTCLRNGLKAASVDPYWQHCTTLEAFAVDGRLFSYHRRWLDRLREQSQLQPFDQLQPVANLPTPQLRPTELPQQQSSDDLTRQLRQLFEFHQAAVNAPNGQAFDHTPTAQHAIDVDSLLRKPAATADQAATVIQAETTSAIDVDSLLRNPATTTTEAVDPAELTRRQLMRRRKLRRKVLLWLAETIAFLSLSVGIWLVVQNTVLQPTPVASPAPSPGTTKKPTKEPLQPAPTPASKSKPKLIRPPSEPPPLTAL